MLFLIRRTAPLPLCQTLSSVTRGNTPIKHYIRSTCSVTTNKYHHRPLLYKIGITCYSTGQSKRNIKPFKLLQCDVNIQSDACQSNLKSSKLIEEEIIKKSELVFAGGGPKAVERHTKVNKKLLAEDRLKLLLDEDSDFLELSLFAGLHMEYGDVPRAGLISGIGKINGIYCLLIVNDASVKGGTIYPIGVKKQVRAQEIAIQNHIPVLYVIDSGGAFLPLQAEIFPDRKHGGRTFYNEAILSSMDIPQLAVVVGSCTAGGAYVPTMAQEAIIVHEIGTIFLGGPPLVYAALREKVSAEDLGGATLHSSVSGCTDYFAADEHEAYTTARDTVATFNIDVPDSPPVYDEPLYSTEDIPALIPRDDLRDMNIKSIIARLVDGSRFHEFKAKYGVNLITGFAYLKGRLIGLLGNNGELSEDAATKGAHFVQLCCQRNIPLVFLQNTVPTDTNYNSVQEACVIGRRIKSQARMMETVACAQVPKITIVTGNSFGVESYAMGGASFDTNFVFTWPCARISMTEPNELVQQLMTNKFVEKHDSEPTEYKEYHTKITDTVRQQTSALYAASRMWNDGIILPQDTRQVIGQCLDIIYQSYKKKPFQSAVLRM